MTLSSLPSFAGLAPGSTIRVIAPANFVTEADMAPGRAHLEAAGFVVEYCKDLFAREGQFAGSDQTRAASLMRAFADPKVDAIICARGGYGSPRILPLIDWDQVAAHHKPFVGYSDLTAVMARLVHQCGMRAFHGPVLRDLKADADPETISSLLAALRGEGSSPDLSNAVGIQDGDAQGPLVGGNLTMLASIMGTGSGFSADGCILLLEDVSEYIYRLDRALVQMCQAGALTGVRGVVISDLVDVEDGTVPFGLSALEMIRAHFKDIPIVAGIPAGHGPKKYTWVLGADTELRVGGAEIRLTQRD